MALWPHLDPEGAVRLILPLYERHSVRCETTRRSDNVHVNPGWLPQLHLLTQDTNLSWANALGQPVSALNDDALPNRSTERVRVYAMDRQISTAIWSVRLHEPLWVLIRRL